MPPRPSYRIDRAAWIMARAFTPQIVLAPLALPWTLLSVIPGTLRRGLYLDPTRTGMVMLYRSNPVLDVLVLFPIMLIVFGAYCAAASALTNIAGWLALSLPVATVVLMIGLLFLLPRGGGACSPGARRRRTGRAGRSPASRSSPAPASPASSSHSAPSTPFRRRGP